MLLTQTPQADIGAGADTELVILVMLGVGGLFTIVLLVLLAFLLRHSPGNGPKKTPPARPEGAPTAKSDLTAGDTAVDGAKVIKLDD